MHHPLKNALPIVAAAYGEKFGVKVLIQGQDAFTDGQSIVIPAACPDDPGYQQVAWGYLAHEAAHLRHTDFDVVTKAAREPLRRALLNVFEDVRIEQALAQDYPGTRRTIHAVLRHMVDRGLMAAPQHPAPAELLQGWLLYRLRSRWLGQSVLESLYRVVDRQCQAAFPAGVMARLSALASTVGNLASTADALALADAVLKMLKEEADKAAESEAARSGNDASHSAPSAEQANATANALPNGSDWEEQGTDSGQTMLKADQTHADHRALLQQVLSAGDDELRPDTFEQVAAVLSREAGQYQGLTPPTLPVPEAAAAGNRNLFAKAAGESARLRARLRGLVQASQDRRDYPRQRGRRVAAARLARSQAGDTRLFVRNRPRIAPNAAVHLLVDVSSSMGKTAGEASRKRCHIANESALALAFALEGIPGVAPAVSFFPGRRSAVAVALRPRQSVRRQAGYFDQQPRGGTPMAEAMWFAAHDLLCQPQHRKLMIVLTDGEPDDECATRDIVERCQHGGLELLGIGIQTVAVKRLFPSSVVIANVADLKVELFEITRRLLLAPSQ